MGLWNNILAPVNQFKDPYEGINNLLSSGTKYQDWIAAGNPDYYKQYSAAALKDPKNYKKYSGKYGTVESLAQRLGLGGAPGAPGMPGAPGSTASPFKRFGAGFGGVAGRGIMGA